MIPKFCAICYLQNLFGCAIIGTESEGQTMAKVKGKAKLNKAIGKELAPFGIKGAKVDTAYAYFCDDATVTFKLTENAIEDKWFIEFIKERFDYDVRFPFVMSLLHEVGHHKANDDVDGEVYDFCIAEKERIEREMETADDDRSKVLEWQYFNLPDEIMATAWAVAYAKAHPKKVKKMWKNMQEALLTFYEKNGIIDLESEG